MQTFFIATATVMFFLVPLSILSLFGIPVYSLIHHLLKKRIENKTNRRLMLWLLTILSTPVFFVSCIVFFFMVTSYYPKHAFTENRWATEKETRYEMEDDLINSKLLVGKTKAEVVQIVGLEGNELKSDSWRYFMGKKPGFTFESSQIEVNYKDGKVETVGRMKPTD